MENLNMTATRTTKAKDTAEVAEKTAANRAREAAIGNNILATLGKPKDFSRIEVRNLHANRYRINVRIEKDGFVKTYPIVDSFYVTVDSDGGILETSPKLLKRY